MTPDRAGRALSPPRSSAPRPSADPVPAELSLRWNPARELKEQAVEWEQPRLRFQVGKGLRADHSTPNSPQVKNFRQYVLKISESRNVASSCEDTPSQ